MSEFLQDVRSWLDEFATDKKAEGHSNVFFFRPRFCPLCGAKMIRVHQKTIYHGIIDMLTGKDEVGHFTHSICSGDEVCEHYYKLRFFGWILVTPKLEIYDEWLEKGKPRMIVIHEYDVFE